MFETLLFPKQNINSMEEMKKMKKVAYILLAALLIMTLPTALALDTESSITLTLKDVRNKEKLMDKIPANLSEVDIAISKTVQPNRFLLYTNDGKNVMWGLVANGYFRGKDNHNKYTWGIYGQNVFAGFYDGEFFWGKYRNGRWIAHGLFGLKNARGKFVVFPQLTPSVLPVETIN